MILEETKQSIKEEVVKKEDVPIYAMPEKFFGLEPGVRAPEAPKVIIKEIIKEVLVTPPPPPKGFGAARKRKKLYIILGIIGAIFLLGGISVYVFRGQIFKKPIATPPKVVTPANVNVAPEIPVIPPSQATPTSTPEIVEEETLLFWKNALDSDGDGLTDDEELTYGTDFSKPDSDSDGFLDGHEVFHLYNPVGKTPVRLLDTGSVKIYKNTAKNFDIYYPSPWQVEVVSEDEGHAMFISPTGEFVQVLLEENNQHLPIVNWYLEQSPGVTVGNLETFVTKSNLDGIKSPDRLNAYFSSDGEIYVISYNIGSRVSASFYRTFEMMLNSFKIIR